MKENDLQLRAEQLLSVINEPENFLAKQQKLLYENPPQISETEINIKGLPKCTDSFYIGKKIGEFCNTTPTEKLSRVLNIASGSDEQRQLPHAINLDISPTGKPHVVADARYLPFDSHSISVAMASHVLEHFHPNEIPDVLKEWLRVIHSQGILRIAVPDAEIALREIVEGRTHKGEKAIDFEHGSAPLTQIYGLGGGNIETDDRWRHHIIFSEALLQWYLRKAGYEDINKYDEAQALSLISGIKLDETNSYSLKMEAKSKIEIETGTTILPEEEYLLLKEEFTPTTPLSIVVPVHNEESKLPQFFWALLSSIKKAQLVNFEVIFALNGCNDKSAELVQYFAEQVDFPVIVAKTDKGILPAFIGGIKARKLDGYIAKMDVDVSPHPHALGLMYMFLSQNEKVQVTYAYPETIEGTCDPYNVGEVFQEFRTKRNFFHGRMSMYRQNPFSLFNETLILNSGAVVEDMILSSCYAYYYGLDSISPTSHAIVRSATPTSLDFLVHQRSRIRKETKRVLRQFPQFGILKKVLARKPLLPDSNDQSKKAELQRYYFSLTKSMSHLAKVISPDGLDDNHEWTIKNQGSFKMEK